VIILVFASPLGTFSMNNIERKPKRSLLYNERSLYMKMSHTELKNTITRKVSEYTATSSGWYYNETDVPKYMLVDHLEMLITLINHNNKMADKSVENLNKHFRP